ncbi:hypothetical protein SLEP1_g18978 [Rubroshorea leprosula]|uniref:Uncharacterized protein n=1 Tax=Rubroshorea leprosula TaxID=152421 RepID=A0AAV5IZ82_9ROSI|nr:hypothetical protein SLEP1_g18978 [Rubroshorea leprosula]
MEIFQFVLKFGIDCEIGVFSVILHGFVSDIVMNSDPR